MWGTESQQYGLGQVISFLGQSYLSPSKNGWIGLFEHKVEVMLMSIYHVPGTVLGPENTIGSNQTRPPPSVLVESVGWEVSPF